MKIKDIEFLRDRGFKIKVTHFRKTQYGMMSRREIDDWDGTMPTGEAPIIQPCGGRVECIIEAPDGRLATGVANCSKRDNFKRKTGTSMAFGRASHELGLGDREKTEWPEVGLHG